MISHRLAISHRIPFAASHRLADHEGPCKSLHGHNFTAEFFVTAPRLDSLGRIVDFDVIKARLGSWIEQHWCHTCIVAKSDTEAVQALSQIESQRVYVLDQPPTVENLALHLLHDVAPERLSGTDAQVVKVALWEDEHSRAIAELNTANQ